MPLPQRFPLAPAIANPHSARRALLQRSALGLGLGVACVAAPALVQTAWAQGQRLQPTPRQTEGPFYPVALPTDSDADLLRNGTLQQYSEGQPVWVEGRVTDTEGTPLAGGVVEIWQCDAAGHYHHPGDGGRAAAGFQGFGRVTLGRDGRYRFRTIRPAPYSGRTPHIHFKVRLAQRAAHHPDVRGGQPRQRARFFVEQPQ